MNGYRHGGIGSGVSPYERRILIVDDEADLLEYRGMLAEAAPGYRLAEARTGAEAIAGIAAHTFDCVLLDSCLPDRSAEEFLADVAGTSYPPLPPVPIVVVTGEADHEVARRMLTKGAQDYVVKGTLNPAGLVRVIENAIDKHAIRRELEHQRASLEIRTWQLDAARSELEEKVAELAFATQAKDQFLAVMSHEMRTPLNAILGYAELLQMGIRGELSEQAREYLERIRVGGRHLLDLINDVLDLSRAEADQLELELMPVDLYALAEEVTQLLEGEASQRGISIVLGPPPETMPPVVADLRRVRQIITNLIGNAIKFSDEGSIGVTIEPRADRVAVRVSDEGIGIPSEVLPMVFDRFFQADGSFNRRRGGSGLGLAIAQRLARLMGGEIIAASEIGRGSVFTLLLPVAAESRLEEARRSARESAELASLEQARREAEFGDGAGVVGVSGEAGTATGVAVADGIATEAGAEPAIVVVAYSRDRDALDALSRHVTPMVRMVSTTDHDRVRDIAIEHNAGLVVLDISSDHGSAWHAAQSLQDVPELTGTAVLLLPTIPPPRGTEPTDALDLGWVSLVPKPFTAEQLTAAVSRAAAGQGENRADRRSPDTGYEVLVVDDDAESRHVARRFLENAGLAVRDARDGESALIAMRHRTPDVVVLDLMMPVLDGFGVLAAMRADVRLASIPVVVLSAKSLTEPERRFLVRSTVRVLQKGQHRLADVASLVLRAAESVRTQRNG